MRLLLLFPAFLTAIIAFFNLREELILQQSYSFFAVLHSVIIVASIICISLIIKSIFIIKNSPEE